jgi:hypothetical protein
MGQIQPFAAKQEGHETARSDARFARIEAYYRELHQHLEHSGQGCYRATALGAWAASIAHHVYHFFRELRLDRQRLVIDLGSGDGLVTCIAGLFTDAVGIEIDELLCLRARRAIRELGLDRRVTTVCGNYLTQRFRHADCLYVYPDKPLDGLEAMLAGWEGMLLVAGAHFPLRSFVPVQEFTRGWDRLVVYRRCDAAVGL